MSWSEHTHGGGRPSLLGREGDDRPGSGGVRWWSTLVAPLTVCTQRAQRLGGVVLTGALLVVLASCGSTPSPPSPVDSAAASSPPLHPFVSLYTGADVRHAGAFLARYDAPGGVGGHEFDAIVLGLGRSHDKPNSLRVSVLARDGQVWIIRPSDDTVADDLAALIGKGDWVIVHKHDTDSNTTWMYGDHDVRLVQKSVVP